MKEMRNLYLVTCIWRDTLEKRNIMIFDSMKEAKNYIITSLKTERYNNLAIFNIEEIPYYMGIVGGAKE